jgi:hypothetical protein
LKRLLEKDPKKRITASDALNHDFFTKDNMFAEFNNNRTSVIGGRIPLHLSENR